MNTSTNERCAVCGEGCVTNQVDQVETDYKGTKGQVPMHYKCCAACGSDFASADESRLNKRAVLAFRKSVEGLLSGAEIHALRQRYCINQKQAARLFGGGPVAFSKYENDDVAHSESMDKLLRLVLQSEQIFWTLVQQAGMRAELTPKDIGQARAAKKVSLDSNVIYVGFPNRHYARKWVSQPRQYQGGDETNGELRQWKQ